MGPYFTQITGLNAEAREEYNAEDCRMPDSLLAVGSVPPYT